MFLARSWMEIDMKTVLLQFFGENTVYEYSNENGEHSSFELALDALKQEGEINEYTKFPSFTGISVFARQDIDKSNRVTLFNFGKQLKERFDVSYETDDFSGVVVSYDFLNSFGISTSDKIGRNIVIYYTEYDSERVEWFQIPITNIYKTNRGVTDESSSYMHAVYCNSEAVYTKMKQAEKNEMFENFVRY